MSDLELHIPLQRLVLSVHLPTGVMVMCLELLVHGVQEVLIGDCANEKASFVEESDDPRLLHLYQVTDDLVVEVVNLEWRLENVFFSHYETENSAIIKDDIVTVCLRKAVRNYLAMS